MSGTPSRLMDQQTRVWELKQRLEKCWDRPISWDLYPEHLKEGCEQLGKALDMPPEAILSGILLLTSFFLSHCAVKVPDTVWIESAILRISIVMPTGSGKTPLFNYLTGILQRVREKLKIPKMHPPWLLDEASFEKMGELMATNHSKLLAMYDELSSYLAQINVYRGKGLSDSHDLSTFLSLYNGKSWTRATVSGDANFQMERTALTVGGFTQPSVAKGLIELPASIEKGLSQRFLWLFPKPSFSMLESLETVDEKFCCYLVDRLSTLWRSSASDLMEFEIPKNCPAFRKKYNSVQQSIEQISILDELLAGMLGKEKGQILRVAANMHVYFGDTRGEDGSIVVHDIPSIISEECICAAQDYVDTCCQHAAYISGRGSIDDEIKSLSSYEVPPGIPSSVATASFCLTLPGKNLHLSSLLQSKKFRNKGNKEGALAAFQQLQSAGLGKIQEDERHRGTSAVYTFIKKDVGDNPEEMMTKLAQFGVTLSQYQEAMRKKEIIVGQKRLLSEDSQDRRRSPRKNRKNDQDAQSEV